MRSKALLGVALFAMTQLSAGASMAAQNCSDWLDQGNGTSWATCVDDNGVQHCWLINNTPGSTAYEVSCSG